MLELIKSIMAKPLQGIVAALCVVTISIHLGLTEVKLAQAKTEVEQERNEKINTLVFDMNNTLIRMDSNIEHMRTDLNKVSKSQQDALVLWSTNQQKSIQ